MLKGLLAEYPVGQGPRQAHDRRHPTSTIHNQPYNFTRTHPCTSLGPRKPHPIDPSHTQSTRRTPYRPVPTQSTRRAPNRPQADALVIDVLSVKAYAKHTMLSLLPATADVLCTHPMFGPDSGKHGWTGAV